MKAWLKLVGATCIAAAGPAAAQSLPTVDANALAAMARACIGLSADVEPTRAHLLAQGWQPGSFSSKGKTLSPAETNLEIYSRAGVLLLLTPNSVPPGCVAMAKAKRSMKAAELTSLVSASVGKQAVPVKAGQTMWLLDAGQALMLAHNPKNGAVNMIFTASEQKKN